MNTYTVGYFVGSLTRASINRKLARALTRLAPPRLTMREIPIGDLPLYSADYEADYPPPKLMVTRCPITTRAGRIRTSSIVTAALFP